MSTEKNQKLIGAHGVVLETIKELTKLRSDGGIWIDDEIEQKETESQVYKRLEAILCYLSTVDFPAIWQHVVSDTKDWLTKDIEYIFSTIGEDGFFASPYAMFAHKEDQYVDLACDVMGLCSNVASGFPTKKAIVGKAKNCFQVAFELLTNDDSFFEDTNVGGCVWSATTNCKIVRPSPLSNYFTSLFAIAINDAVINNSGWLNEDQIKKAEDLGKKACRYILAFSRDGIVMPGSEIVDDLGNIPEYEKLVYSCWGVRALLRCWDWLDANEKKTAKTLVNGFVELVDQEVGMKKFYHQPFSRVGQSMFYENRTAHGGVLGTLAIISDEPDFANFCKSNRFQDTAGNARARLMNLRDPESKLWYQGSIEVSGLQLVITDLLLFGKQFGDLDKLIQLTPSEIRTHLKSILESKDVLGVIANIVTEGLASLSEHQDVLSIFERLNGGKNKSKGNRKKRNRTKKKRK